MKIVGAVSQIQYTYKSCSFKGMVYFRVVIVCTGGNIDTTTLTRALERGMAAEGRLIKFKVTVVDRPGGMADLCGLLANLGVTMRDCVPERAWVKGDVFSCDVSNS